MSETVAIVTPLDDHMGLDISRSLGKRGIPVYGIDTLSASSEIGKCSKYCRFIQSPEPEAKGGAVFMQFLEDFGKKLGRKAVLYPLSDYHVLLCSRNRESLRTYYEFVMPDTEIVERLTTKDGLYQLAQKHGIPSPHTYLAGKPECIKDISNHITYPAILKPIESTYWHTAQMAGLLRHGLTAGRAKVVLCENPADLLKAYHIISQYDDRLVVQEVIPGEDSRLVYFSFYLDRQSRPLGLFAGRKHRILPTGFGSASYVRSFYEPELIETGLGLLSATHYQGLGGIEFKKDVRDERYKLVEFNTRFGMWDGLSVRCGVDLPYISYCDALHLPVEPQLTYREGVIWVDLQRDVRAALEYCRKGQLSLRQWLGSLQGEKMWAIYSRDDWRPGVAFTFMLFRKMWARIKS